MTFLLIVCTAAAAIRCVDVPIAATTERAARAEWCAAADQARTRGDLFATFAVKIDPRWPQSRELVEWWCR